MNRDKIGLELVNKKILGRYGDDKIKIESSMPS